MIVRRQADTEIASIIADAPVEVDTFKEVAELLATKVDKVSGKQLSSNDYTDNDRDKLVKILVTTEINLDNVISDIETLKGSDISNIGTVMDFELSL